MANDIGFQDDINVKSFEDLTPVEERILKDRVIEYLTTILGDQNLEEATVIDSFMKNYHDVNSSNTMDGLIAIEYLKEVQHLTAPDGKRYFFKKEFAYWLMQLWGAINERSMKESQTLRDLVSKYNMSLSQYWAFISSMKNPDYYNELVKIEQNELSLKNFKKVTEDLKVLAVFFPDHFKSTNLAENYLLTYIFSTKFLPIFRKIDRFETECMGITTNDAGKAIDFSTEFKNKESLKSSYQKCYNHLIAGDLPVPFNEDIVSFMSFYNKHFKNIDEVEKKILKDKLSLGNIKKFYGHNFRAESEEREILAEKIIQDLRIIVAASFRQLKKRVKNNEKRKAYSEKVVISYYKGSESDLVVNNATTGNLSNFNNYLVSRYDRPNFIKLVDQISVLKKAQLSKKEIRSIKSLPLLETLRLLTLKDEKLSLAVLQQSHSLGRPAVPLLKVLVNAHKKIGVGIADNAIKSLGSFVTGGKDSGDVVTYLQGLGGGNEAFREVGNEEFSKATQSLIKDAIEGKFAGDQN